MPFVIAFMAYAVLFAPMFALVAIVVWTRGRASAGVLLAGAVGSLGGLMVGCALAALMCIVWPFAGHRIGATAVVVPAGLVGACLGAAGIAAAAKRTLTSRQLHTNHWSRPKQS